jgi:hypothetical protein
VSEQQGQRADDLSVDIDNLHKEEVFTDLRAASVRRLTPVKADGSADAERRASYIGDTTLMTQMGPLPVQFPIEADSLEDAFAQFPQGVREAVERLNERAKEMAREEASRIVVPGAMPPGMGGGVPGAGGGKVILK